jgi:hypothetical protein
VKSAPFRTALAEPTEAARPGAAGKAGTPEAGKSGRRGPGR